MIIDNPKKIKTAEIIVGIPSYNEAKTIGFVVEQASLGLEKYFPEKKSVIINVDNNSTDKTKEAFFSAKGNIPRIYISTLKDIKGKGRNFYNLFLMVQKLNTKTGLVVDADLKSIQPEWIKKMANPIFDGYDFITPYYARCRADATITNQIVYPLIYGLLGWDVRQPIGGDFAFSREMVDIWLKQDWSETTYQFGIDIFMTLTAFFDKAKTGQVNLDTKVHRLSSPNLGSMFFQVAGTLFEILKKNLSQIKEINQIEKVVILGDKELPFFANNKPDEQLFREIFLANFDSCLKSNEKILSQSVMEKLNEVCQQEQGDIDLNLWTKIVYECLTRYVKGDDKQSIIELLGFLYFGRVATFFRQTVDLTPKEVEQEVIKQAQYFFEHRDYFLRN